LIVKRCNLIGLVVVAALAAACSSDEQTKATPVSAQDVKGRTDTLVKDSLKASLSSIDGITTGSSIDSALEALGNLGSAFANSAPNALKLRAHKLVLRAEQAPTSGASPKVDPEKKSQELVDELDAHVFNDANLESTDAKSAIYLLHGATFCDPIEKCGAGLGSPVVCTQVEDSECIKDIDNLQIRVRATPINKDGIDLDLLVGPDKLFPLRFELRPSSIATEIDLAAAKATVEYAANTLAAPNDQPTLPKVMAGRLRGELTVNGEKDVSVAFSILEAVAVEADTDNGPVAVHFGTATPWLSARVAGLTGAVELALAAGTIDLSLPWKTLAKTSKSLDMLAVHLDGVSFGVGLASRDGALSLKGLGFGQATSYVKKGNATLFALDLNATTGRKLDLGITPDTAASSALLALVPGLDLQLKFNLQAIADENNVPSFLLDETYHLALTGAGSASLLPLKGNALWAGGVKVVTGQLSFSSTGATAAVVVPAGKCLVGVETPADGAHPLLGLFASADCQ
jgi:hypothetical protein